MESSNRDRISVSECWLIALCINVVNLQILFSSEVGRDVTVEKNTVINSTMSCWVTAK